MIKNHHVKDKQDYPFCRFQLMVETFGHKIQNLMKPSKFNKSPKDFEANEIENGIIKLWGLA